MFDASVMAKMTPEQRRQVAMLGVRARELKRLNAEPPIYRPIPEGLQLAALFLDLRLDQPLATHVLLFEAGYKNRYEGYLNNRSMPGLIGWHDAVRLGASRVRPIISD